MAELANAYGLGPYGAILGGSTPLPPTICVSILLYVRSKVAGVAQLVEHNVANVVVVGSRPITRSKLYNGARNERAPSKARKRLQSAAESERGEPEFILRSRKAKEDSPTIRRT